MMSVLVIVLVALWFIPFLMKAKVDPKVLGRVCFGIAAVATIGMVVTMLLEALLGKITAVCLPMIPEFVYTSVFAGLIEETIKVAIALHFVKGVKNARPIDYILIFGAVGFGFEAVESALFTQTLDTAVFRFVTALHIFWMYFDGIAYAKAAETGEKGLLLRSFLICMGLHIAYDLGLGILINNGAAVYAIIAGVLNTALVIYTMYHVCKSCRKNTVPAGICMAMAN